MTEEAPLYSFRNKSLHERREEFKRIVENEDPEDHTISYLVDHSDVDRDGLHKNMEMIKNEYGHIPVPGLGDTEENSGEE